MKKHSIARFIISTPDVLGGIPRIAGRRIAVEHIVRWHLHQGKPVRDIAQEYDLLPAEIHAALAYYYDHQPEIEASLSESEQSWQEGWRNQQKDPHYLAQKMRMNVC